MKKIFTIVLLFSAVIMSAQEIPASFPRKYLIEHFTGEGCKYCPYGMYSIVEYTSQSSIPCIWVSHHTYTDELMITESIAIADVSGVSQGEAPLMSMNRTKITGAEINFHPDLLVKEGMADIIASKCDTIAEASVVIDHTYDATTRALNVTVSGQVANTKTTKYLLTVLIKENGLIGPQKDTYWSWKGDQGGYKEFLHPCVVRDVLSSNAIGDEVAVENQAYSKSYTITLPEEWVAENCCVVAYITPTNKKPIINAEETPLVAGTTGGAEYLPFAITENKEPNNASSLKFDSLTLSKPSEDKLEVKLIASGSTRSDLYGPLKMVVTLEFNTLDTILPTETLEFVDGDVLNTFSAGTVDLVAQTFGGSRLQYYKATDLEALCHTWRIKSGTMTVASNGGFLVEGILDNGKSFKITCNMLTALENVVFDKTHVEKLMRDGQIVIRMDDVEYDMQGRVITQ